MNVIEYNRSNIARYFENCVISLSVTCILANIELYCIGKINARENRYAQDNCNESFLITLERRKWKPFINDEQQLGL